MAWASLGFTDTGGEVAYGVIGGLFFILIGVMAIAVIIKGRKSRGLVICVSPPWAAGGTRVGGGGGSRGW